MLFRKSRPILFQSWANCGSSEIIDSSVAIAQIRRLSRASSVTRSLNCWSPIRRTELSSIVNGGIAPDSTDYGPAEASYMKHRTEGHTETTISGDTRADWSEAFELVPSLQVAYVWHASKFTSEVLAGLLRIGFVHHQQIIWDKQRTVLTRTLYWFQHEPCWLVRMKNAPWYGKAGENSTDLVLPLAEVHF